MTVEVLGFFATHASARALTVVLSSMGWFQLDVGKEEMGRDQPSSANLVNSLTLRSFSWPSGSCSFFTVSLKNSELESKRDPLGMPSLY